MIAESNVDWLLALFDASPPPKPTRQKTIAVASKPVCSRCSGTGRIPSFSHIKAGECFRCHGTGEGK
jgi:hypothetical protein